MTKFIKKNAKVPFELPKKKKSKGEASALPCLTPAPLGCRTRATCMQSVSAILQAVHVCRCLRSALGLPVPVPEPTRAAFPSPPLRARLQMPRRRRRRRRRRPRTSCKRLALSPATLAAAAAACRLPKAPPLFADGLTTTATCAAARRQSTARRAFASRWRAA